MLTLPKSAIVNGVNACRADHSRSGAVSVRVSVNLLTDALSTSLSGHLPTQTTTTIAWIVLLRVLVWFLRLPTQEAA